MRTLAPVLVLSFLFSLAASLSSSATPPLRIAIGIGPAFSHYVQYTAIAKELASRGHWLMVGRYRELTTTRRTTMAESVASL